MSHRATRLADASRRRWRQGARSLRRDTLRNVLRQRSAIIGLRHPRRSSCLIAIFAAVHRPVRPERVDARPRRDRASAGRPPCIHLLGCPTDQPQHLMGLDSNVRDEFSRVVYGVARLAPGRLRHGRPSRSSSARSSAPSPASSAARPDNVLMRLMDVVLSFPSLILAIAIVTVLGTGPHQRACWRSAIVVDPDLCPGHARLGAVRARDRLRDRVARARRVVERASCRGASCPTR